MTDFTGKTVLITGGAGQIGKATAKAFLNAGASVALVDLSEDMLEDAAQQLGCHDRLLLLAADVSDEAAVAEYVCRTEAHFGHIDIFFIPVASASTETTGSPARTVRAAFFRLHGIMGQVKELGFFASFLIKGPSTAPVYLLHSIPSLLPSVYYLMADTKCH